ncbi:MAG TPA: hypothetical protein VFW24_13960 [Acidimicrobiales bacterium]|nr:hypothetical protein [Acidimicrobiales bacterium]
MTPASSSALPVYVEVGQKRTFAAAVDWPGWCRSGGDEEAALEALAAYAGRYKAALGARARGLGVVRAGDLEVVERLPGDSSTDFGAPGAVPFADEQPIGGKELDRWLRILQSCWHAFDRIADDAVGAALATGPRGGGRNLDKIRAHVLDGAGGYLGRLGGKVAASDRRDPAALRKALADAAAARARGEVPDRGPRGGLRWPARYGIRRTAWHALDHAWEIEDRVRPAG